MNWDEIFMDIDRELEKKADHPKGHKIIQIVVAETEYDPDRDDVFYTGVVETIKVDGDIYILGRVGRKESVYE